MLDIIHLSESAVMSFHWFKNGFTIVMGVCLCFQLKTVDCEMSLVCEQIGSLERAVNVNLFPLHLVR